MTWQLQQFLAGATGLAFPPRTALAGKWLAFAPDHTRSVCGYQTYQVISRRGNFGLGVIEFSNQWGAYSFVPHMQDRVRLGGELLAEVYAYLRSLEVVTGRFV